MNRPTRINNKRLRNDAFKKRSWIVNMLLAVTGVLTTAINLTATPIINKAELGNLPLVIRDFTGTELPVEQEIKDILETPNIVMRNYVGPDGTMINLAIVYYEQYRVSFHLPEGCMTGEGSTMVAQERETVEIPGDGSSIVANKLRLRQFTGTEYVYYFFLTGDLITPSYSRMRFNLMKERVKRRTTGAALVRFSANNNGEDEKTLKALRSFIAETVPLLRPHLRTHLQEIPSA